MFKNDLKHQKDKWQLIAVNFFRLLFACLIIFELLNLFNILHFVLQFTWLGLIITTCVILTLLEITAYKYQKKKGHHLHWSIWMIVLIGLALDASGDVFLLYGKFGWWDQVTHLFISAVACFILFTVISAFWVDKFKFSLLFKSGKLKLSLFLAATSTLSLGVFYELEEYAEDLIFKTHRLGLGTDTANDLFFNSMGVLGVVILVSIYYHFTRKRKFFD